MQGVRKRVSVLIIMFILASSSLAHVASALPATWEWENTTPNSWADVEEETGSMMWGSIYQTIEFEGDVWAAGRDSAGHGVLWQYDVGTGVWSNQTPGDMNNEDNYALSSLTIHDDTLYVGTSNSDGAQLWYRNGATWDRDLDFSDAETGIGSIDSMTNLGSQLCVTGSSGDGIEVYCNNNENEWVDMSPASAGAIYEANDTTLIAVGGVLYVNARTLGSFEGIWKYFSGSWSQVQTPFTDEDEDEGGEETRWNVSQMARGSDGQLTVIIHDGYGVMQVQAFNGTDSWAQIGDNNFGHPDDESYSFGRMTVYNGNLVVGVGGYGNTAEVYEWNGDNWLLRNSDYFGADYNEDGFNPLKVSSMTVIDGTLFAATAAEGEGSYFAQVWRTPAFEVGEDEGEDEDTGPNADDDTVSDTIESAAPNGGDANNDGTPDKDQANVTSFVNPVTNQYAVLQSDCTSNADAGVVGVNSLAANDGAFSYPAGLMNFTLTCATPGITANVAMYYYGDYDASVIVARKYNSTTHAYTTISGATATNVTIGDQKAVKVSYPITDGGILDQDGTANGSIVDPAGPGINSVGVPNTGGGGTTPTFWLLRL